METPAFAKVQEAKEVSRLPLKDLLASQPRPLLLGMGTRFVEGFTFNLFSVYLLAYVVTNLGLPRDWALRGIVVGAGLGVLLVPLASVWSTAWSTGRSRRSGPSSSRPATATPR